MASLPELEQGLTESARSIVRDEWFRWKSWFTGPTLVLLIGAVGLAADVVFSWAGFPFQHSKWIRYGLWPVSFVFAFMGGFSQLARLHMEITRRSLTRLGTAITVYGDVAQVRGRDCFGAVFGQQKAASVEAVVTLSQPARMDASPLIKYSLLLTITLERETNHRDSLPVEVSVNPRSVEANNQFSCDRIDRIPSYLLTFDLFPLVVDYPRDAAEATLNEGWLEDYANKILKKVKIERQLGDKEPVPVRLRKRKSRVRLRNLGQHNREVRMPRKTGRVEGVFDQIRFRVEGLTHPMSVPFLAIVPPMRTRMFAVGVDNQCKDYCRHAEPVCIGDGTRLVRKPFDPPYDVAAKGFEWHAADDWMITPVDSSYIYLTMA